MDLKGFLKNTFKTDIFSKLKSDQILEERVKTEKEIERLSDEIKLIQDKIRALMLSSKGQPNTMKMLNIQKIKAFRIESSTKQKEASILIKRLQLILLIEAMKEHHESEEKNEFIEKIVPTSKDTRAVKTSAALNKFQRESYKIMKEHPANRMRKLPANYLLLRGAGRYREIRSFHDKHGMSASVIAASPVVKGLCRTMNFDVSDVAGATGDSRTNLQRKAMAAIEALKERDFVLLHIKAPDLFSHDRDFNGKKYMLERIDREVFRRIMEYGDMKNTLLVVTSDHPTSVETGQHVEGFMPFLIYTSGIAPNKVMAFNEKSCRLGPMISPNELMELVVKFK